MTTLYEVLGVQLTATPGQIKEAYRRLSRKHHPDRGGNTEDFQKISKAYAVLSDSEKRRKYDENGDLSTKDMRAEMLTHVTNLLMSVIDQVSNPQSTNLLELMKVSVRTNIQRHKGELGHLNNAITRREEVAKRLFSKAAEDSITGILQDSLRDIHRKVFEVKATIELGERILEFLDKYEYVVDEVAKATGYVTMYSTGTSSTFR